MKVCVLGERGSSMSLLDFLVCFLIQGNSQITYKSLTSKMFIIFQGTSLILKTIPSESTAEILGSYISFFSNCTLVSSCNSKISVFFLPFIILFLSSATSSSSSITGDLVVSANLEKNRWLNAETMSCPECSYNSSVKQQLLSCQNSDWWKQ